MNLIWLFFPEKTWRSFRSFFYAGWSDPVHFQDIKRMIQSEFVCVADDRGKVVGVLQGRMGCLGSLFVAKSYHDQGVGRGLVEKFEEKI